MTDETHLTSDAARSASAKRNWASPRFRARCRASQRRRWTPEYKRKFAAAMREAYRRKKAREAAANET